jgi:hypothetical protein
LAIRWTELGLNVFFQVPSIGALHKYEETRNLRTYKREELALHPGFDEVCMECKYYVLVPKLEN